MKGHKRRLTAEDRADLARWEAKRESIFREGVNAGNGLALMGIIQMIAYIKEFGTPQLPPAAGPFIRKVKPHV